MTLQPAKMFRLCAKNTGFGAAGSRILDYLSQIRPYKQKFMNIVMIGTGNTATVFCRLIAGSGHEIVQIVGRNQAHAAALAEQYGTHPGNLSDTAYLSADLYIVALQDAPLYQMENLAPLKGKFVVHSAGSVPMDVLAAITDRYGVLYPLQTLSKQTDHVPEVPLLVSANHQPGLKLLLELARSMSPLVSEADDQQRLAYHIAAVFVSNFSNHMFALAQSFCEREGVEFSRLMPLMQEVVARARMHSPGHTQTGPAVRDDRVTIQKHLAALEQHPEMHRVYEEITNSILRLHGKV